jgi:hypothetical protein
MMAPMMAPKHAGKIRPVLIAGGAYFALIFALGFVFGVIRTVWLQPASGGSRIEAVLVEVPIMLAASWWLCRHLVRRFGVPPTLAARGLMGGFAFALLIAAEVLLGALLSARPPTGQLALYREPSYAIGLAAQIGFALIPMLQALRLQSR